MLWFRKKQAKRRVERAEQHHLEQAVTVEVERHKTATAKTIAKTDKIVDNFNNVIRKNGFPLKIHVAAGGKK